MSDERRAGLPIEEEWDDYEHADPLGNCPDEPHRCHACRGSGAREDQTIF